MHFGRHEQSSDTLTDRLTPRNTLTVTLTVHFIPVFMAGLVFSSQNPPQNAKKTQGISCPESLFGPLYVADLVRFSRGEYKNCYPPSNSPPFLPRILAGAQLETGAVHKLCSQQILFINRQIPSSARCFRPFQAKQKDLRYTNYLRSSLSLRNFKGEFLCRVVGGSTRTLTSP